MIENTNLGLVKELVPGQQQISASQYNTVLKFVKKLRTQNPSSGLSGGTIGSEGVSVRGSVPIETWIGVIKDTGYPIDPEAPEWIGVPPEDIPEAEEDLEGPLYWVWKAKRTNPSSDTLLHPPIYEAIEEEDPGHQIVIAFNYSELDTGLHGLATDGTVVVRVTGMWIPSVQDGQVQAPLRVYWFERYKGYMDALIVAEGPEGEDDFLDNRYWAVKAKCTNEDETEAETLEAVEEAVPFMITNRLEALSKTHYLRVDQPITVLGESDETDPAIQRFFTCAMPWLVLFFLGCCASSSGSLLLTASAMAWRGNYFERYISEPADIGGTFYGFAWYKGQLYGIADTLTLADSSTAIVVRYDFDSRKWVSVDGVYGSGGHNIYYGLAILVWDDKLIIAGGYNVEPTMTVWSYDGNEDGDWELLELPESMNVYCLAEYGGDLYAGGQVGLGSDTGIYRLPHGSSTWEVPGGGLSADPYGTCIVYGLCVFNDGTNELLIICGQFGTGSWRNVTSFDGTDLAAIGTGLEAAMIYAVCQFEDDEGIGLYAGGRNLAVGNPLARWDGYLWRPAGETLAILNPLVYEALEVTSLKVFRHELLVGGCFHAVDIPTGQVDLNHIARYISGTDSFTGVVKLNGSPLVIYPWTSGLLIGGSFTKVNNAEVPRLFQLIGSTVNMIGNGYPSAAVRCADRIVSTEPEIGGDFIWIGDDPCTYAAYLQHGFWWSKGGFDGPVYAIYYDATDDYIHYFGSFNQGGGTISPCWVMFDRATPGTWKDMVDSAAGNPVIRACCAVGRTLYIVGKFTELNGVTCNNCAKIDLDTLVVSAMGSGCLGELYSITYYDSKIVVGGWITHVNGVSTVQQIAAWNEATDTWTIYTSMAGFAGPVYALATWMNEATETLLAGVYGKPAGMVARHQHLLRALPAGGSWSTLAVELNDTIRVIAMDTDGTPIIGGDFDQMGTSTGTFHKWAMCFIAYKNRRFRMLGGGVGHMPNTGPLQLSSGRVVSITVLPRDAHYKTEEVLLGTIGGAPGSFCYSPGIGMLTIRGWRPVQGGLYWSLTSPVWAYGAYALLQEGTAGGVMIGGNFSGGYNAVIAPEDADTVDMLIASSGTIRYDGHYFVPTGDFPGRCVGLAKYGDDVIGIGLDNAPRVHNPVGLSWSVLSSEFDDSGEYHHICEMGTNLWVFGIFSINEGDAWPTVAYWNGEHVIDASPTDVTRVNFGLVGDLGFGEFLYIGCDSALDNTVKVRSGGLWGNVGSGLTGEARQLVIIDFGGDIGKRLFACGVLEVGGIDAGVVMFEDGVWIPIIREGGFGQITAIIGPTASWQPIRLTVTGDINSVYDIVNARTVVCSGVAFYHPSQGVTADFWGGVAGQGFDLA